MLMKLKNIEQHLQCQCEIRYRPFKGKTESTPGLFCSTHDVFLDWLNRDMAVALIQSGVKVTPYIDRKQSKKKTTKSKNYQVSKYYYQRAKKRAKKSLT